MVEGVADALDVDHRHLLAEIAAAGQRQRAGGEGRILGGAVEDGGEGGDQARVERPRPRRPRRARGPGARSTLQRQALAGVPAGEGVLSCGHQHGQLVVAVAGVELHRGREAAQQRRHRLRRRGRGR